MEMAKFETVQLGEIKLHLLRTEKFKTTSLAVLMQQALTPEKVTATALLPQVLQRGTESYPSTLELARRSDELYGASLFGDVFKRGERHMLQFGLDLANEQYLQEPTPLLAKGLDFLSEVLFAPALDKGKFRKDYVEGEKKNLAQRLKGLADDKQRYASIRLNQEMCKGEPFALYAHGQLADLEKLDAEALYTYYEDVLASCPIDVYCVGNVQMEELLPLIEQRFEQQLPSGKRKQMETAAGHKAVREEQVVIDRMEVNQGKLNIGLRTQLTIEDDAYPALLLYNGVLGGFAHSKLFMNVREKASLAYYCSSRVESHKGLLSIQSGIEIDKYEQALSIIKEQLSQMQQGQITDQEIDKTKAIMINQFRERQDSAYGMIDLHHHSHVSKRKWEIDELIAQIQDTSREQIEQVAQNVVIDTIYFLRDKGGVADAKA